MDSDRNDLYQETLREVWESLDRWESRCSIGTWVQRVALNTASTFKRKAARRRREGREIERHCAHAPAEALRGPDEDWIINDLIDSLGPVDRGMFSLFLNNTGYR